MCRSRWITETGRWWASGARTCAAPWCWCSRSDADAGRQLRGRPRRRRRRGAAAPRASGSARRKSCDARTLSLPPRVGADPHNARSRHAPAPLMRTSRIVRSGLAARNRVAATSGGHSSACCAVGPGSGRSPPAGGGAGNSRPSGLRLRTPDVLRRSYPVAAAASRGGSTCRSITACTGEADANVTDRAVRTRGEESRRDDFRRSLVGVLRSRPVGRPLPAGWCVAQGTAPAGSSGAARRAAGPRASGSARRPPCGARALRCRRE